jgi:uncharacterized protein YbjT (DUF2867 family)
MDASPTESTPFVNAVGILREMDSSRFDIVHTRAPITLFHACAAAGIRVIQVSALGADAGAATRYFRSKGEADEALLRASRDGVVVQPSLVYGPDGASGRLFMALATLPVIPLPGAGNQRIQPIHLDDLARCTVRLLETDRYARQRVPLVGASPLTLSSG